MYKSDINKLKRKMMAILVLDIKPSLRSLCEMPINDDLQDAYKTNSRLENKTAHTHIIQQREDST
jgi:hypothetical protein